MTNAMPVHSTPRRRCSASRAVRRHPESRMCFAARSPSHWISVGRAGRVGEHDLLGVRVVGDGVVVGGDRGHATPSLGHVFKLPCHREARDAGRGDPVGIRWIASSPLSERILAMTF